MIMNYTIRPTFWWYQCVTARSSAWPWCRPWFETDDEESRWQRRRCFYQLQQWGPSADHWRLMLLTHWLHTVGYCNAILNCWWWWHPEDAVCQSLMHNWFQLEQAYQANSTWHAPPHGSGSQIARMAFRCIRGECPTYITDVYRPTYQLRL